MGTTVVGSTANVPVTSQGLVAAALGCIIQGPAPYVVTFGSVTASPAPVPLAPPSVNATLFNVTGATGNGVTIVLTVTSTSGLANGQSVVVSGVQGNTAANNTAGNPSWPITVVDSTHVSLTGSTGNGTYTGGGQFFVQGQSYTYQGNPTYAVQGATNAAPIVISVANTAGLSNGVSVSVIGVLGNTAANGTWTIGSLTGSTFALVGSNGTTSAPYTSGGTVIAPLVTATGVTPSPLQQQIASINPQLAAARDAAIAQQSGLDPKTANYLFYTAYLDYLRQGGT